MGHIPFPAVSPPCSSSHPTARRRPRCGVGQRSRPGGRRGRQGGQGLVQRVEDDEDRQRRILRQRPGGGDLEGGQPPGQAHGFRSHYVNIGCFIDESVFCPADPPLAKRYDAVINARFTIMPGGKELKRHDLTGKLQRLALLDPINASDAHMLKARYTQRPNCVFFNTGRLPPHRVAEILQQSCCGLILSPLEGVCRASSEYLLTGLPVVSTHSVGGRDVWYDAYNAIIVQATDDAIVAAVEKLKANPRDPWRIRTAYLAQAQVFRERFRDEVLQPILAEFGVDEDAGAVMAKWPFRWWLDQ
jgi:hypothetical protein